MAKSNVVTYGSMYEHTRKLINILDCIYKFPSENVISKEVDKWEEEGFLIIDEGRDVEHFAPQFVHDVKQGFVAPDDQNGTASFCQLFNVMYQLTHLNRQLKDKKLNQSQESYAQMQVFFDHHLRFKPILDISKSTLSDFLGMLIDGTDNKTAFIKEILALIQKIRIVQGKDTPQDRIDLGYFMKIITKDTKMMVNNKEPMIVDNYFDSHNLFDGFSNITHSYPNLEIQLIVRDRVANYGATFVIEGNQSEEIKNYFKNVFRAEMSNMIFQSKQQQIAQKAKEDAIRKVEQTITDLQSQFTLEQLKEIQNRLASLN